MIIKLDNVPMQLIQLSSLDDFSPKGLYLIPASLPIAVFEEKVKEFDNQDDFDENNEIGAQRIFPYDSIIDIDW